MRSSMLFVLALAGTLSTLVPAQAARQDILELVELTDLSGAAISPDGRLVAFRQDRPSVAANEHLLEWFVVPADGSGAPRRVASGGSGLFTQPGMLAPQNAVWAADGHSFYFRALTGEGVQVWQAFADGAAARRVTSDPANVQNFRLDPATGRILYTVGATRREIEQAEQQEHDNGVLIDGSRDVLMGLYRESWIDGRLATRRWNGGWFMSGGLLSDRPTSQRLFDPATGEARAAVAGDVAAFERFAPADVTWGQPSPPPAAVDGRLATGKRSREEQGIRVARDAAFTDPQICRDPVCQRAGGIAWRPGHNEIVFSSHDDAQVQSLYRWELGTDRVTRIVTGEGLLNAGRTRDTPCAIAADFAVCVSAAASRPPRLERVDLETGARKVLADPNAAASVPPVQAERLEWKDASGRPFAGQLFLPPERKGPSPLFIVYYVCDGYLRGSTGDEWPLAALARTGIAALCINKATPKPGPQDAISDYRNALEGVRAAIDLLHRRGLVDRNKVGMGGLSFGSEVTLWTLMKSNLLAAASIASVEIEPIYYWANGHAGRTIHGQLRGVWGLGAPDETPARWKEISPALNAHRMKAPLLMQLPEQELRFNAELHARLSNSTTPVETIGFPNEPHIKFMPRHKLAVYERNLDWFRFWLQGYEDPDPAKAAQYIRWRAARDRQPTAGRK